MKKLDIIGKRYGRLVVIGYADNYVKNGKIRSQWLCQCDCGKQKVIKYDSLKSGGTKSCGCYQNECRKNNNKKHGCSYERLYHVWLGIKSRCLNEKNSRYLRYGGRGITICDEWANDYLSFRKWAIENGYDENSDFGEFTIERIDNNGNYCPENCTLISLKKQARNRSTTLKINIDGEDRLLMDIAKEQDIAMNIVISRISKGWSYYDAVFTPLIEQTVKKKVSQFSLDGKMINNFKSIGDASRETGVERSSISRCCLGQRNKAGGYIWRYA